MSDTIAHLVDRLVLAATTALAHGATRWLPTLLDGAVKATLVLALAAGATALMRRWGAATRHLVWSAAVAGVLTIPALSVVAPRWSVPVAVGAIALPPLPSASATVDEPAVAASVDASPTVSVARPAPVSSSSTPDAVVPAISAPAPAAAPAPRVHLSGAAWVAAVWAAGALFVLLRLALGTLGLARLVALSRPATDGTWLVLMQRLSRELGIRRPVTLLVGRTGTVPVTWGVVYPIVLLPADADTWTEERRRAVLLHELAHVERFDALTHVVSQLALAVFWFHPLVILAARRLRAERERACDDLVLAVGTRATAYADDLLDLVRTLGEASPAAAALAMARRSEFEGRLLSILDPKVPRARTSRRAAIAACVVAALTVVPLAGARPTWQPPAAPAAPAAPVASVASVPAAPATPATPAAPATPATPAVAALPAAPAAPATPAAPLGRTTSGVCQPRPGRHVSVQSEDGVRTHTTIADAEHCLEVQVDGRVRFTDDDDDVVSLSPGGMMVVTETRGGVTRQMSIRERGGRLERAYTVDGRIPSNDDGTAWLRTAIASVARESSVGVTGRVARVRRERGVSGVLDDVGVIGSDGVKRAWIEALLANGRLGDDDLREAALVVGRTFASDGDKAAVLRAIADRADANPSIGMAVVTASQSIASDGDRRSVLARVTDGASVTGAVLVYAVHSAQAIASDGDKSALLRALVPRAADLPTLRSAIVDAANTIGSDGDRASVLEPLLARASDDATIVAALRSARAIGSDGDRRRVLVAAVPRTAFGTAPVREAFFAATDATGSDGDHAAVLLALLGRRDLPAPAILGVIHSAARIASDHDKSSVLLELATRRGALDDAATRQAFLAALGTVSSSGDYRRVMERVGTR
ncbi:MAG: hypothetical protein JO180_01890 [Gemmatirosa sp.]|nr:hypothetical protein [Gemmatirosa sp.]